MRGMKSASEDFIVPPPGRYESEIVAASPEVSKKGASMIALQVEIKNPPDYAGCVAYDYIITDGGAKGGGFGKKKLRGLGVNVDATDDDVPDAQICDFLLGKRLWVQYGNEQQMGKDTNGSYTIPETRTDPQTGKQLPLMKLVVKEYFTHNVGGQGQVAALPQQAAPQYQQQLPAQQQLPQQGVPQFAQQPAQGQPQFNPQQPFYGQPPPGQGWQQVPQQQLVQGGQLQASAGAMAQGAPMQQLPANPGVVVPQTNGAGGVAPGAVPPWVAAQAGAPAAEEAKRGKKTK